MTAVNRPDITVNTPSELSDVHVSQQVDGCFAFSIANDTYYVLVKNSGATPDGINIIAPGPGSPIAGNADARWIAVAIPFEISPFVEQINWYIDPINGSDLRKGDTPATALKTWSAFRNRLGGLGFTTLNTGYHVFLMNDFNIDNIVIVDFDFGPAGSLTVHNFKTLVQLYTGTISAATGPNEALNNKAAEFTDLGPVPGTIVNTNTSAPVRLRLTSVPATPAAVDSIAFATKSVGAGVFRTSPFVKCGPAIPIGLPVPYTPVLGDQYVAETGFVQIASIEVRITASSVPFPLAPPYGEKLLFIDVDLMGWNSQSRPVFCHNGAVPGTAPLVQAYGSAVGRAIAGYDSQLGFAACLIQSMPLASTTPPFALFNVIQEQNGGYSLLACAVLCLFNIEAGASRSIIDFNTLFDGSGGGPTAGRFQAADRVIVGTMCVMDSPTGTSGVTLFPGGLIVNAVALSGTSAVYGSGNATFGIDCQSESQFIYVVAGAPVQLKPTITGATANVRISGVNKSYSQIPYFDGPAYTVHTGIIGAVTPSVVQFLLPNYTSSATDSVQFIASAAGTVQNLRLRALTGPGVGISDIYTVLVNGAAAVPPITATLSGAGLQTANDVTNGQPIVAGDRISIQLLAGVSVSANVSASLEVNAASGSGIFLR